MVVGVGVGLFGEGCPLSISDMAERLGRPATSLYHHVRILEEAGVLHEEGTRPKGKRFETVYQVSAHRLELDVDPQDETTTRQAGQTMSAALRMAERDFLAALGRDDVCTEGKGCNLNLPLPRGSGDQEFQQALALGLDRIQAFSPGALVIALGLDAFAGDPFGGLSLSTRGFRDMAAMIKRRLNLPTLMVQEGGYLCDELGENLSQFLHGFQDG